jgi:hypothetical protein
MPLCPQITNTPITVVQNADFTVSSVLPVVTATTTQVDAADAAATAAAAAAQAAQDDADAAAALAAAADAEAAAALAAATAAAAAAGVAQADATEALADAVVAYNAAIASLQPSANTIVNASNQMTAINATGITVYSGSSATSGARVVLNSTGLAGFNAGGTATFSVSASTGAAVFAGSVTGATITGGTLNINGNAIINASGLLTATGATITGDIRATSGYFGTATNGWSISSTDLVGVGTGRITGGTISGTQFTNGGTFSVSPTGFLIASDAEITGTIKASAGYFGTLTNGFLINSTGLTGVGTGTITGGAISGTTFTNGSTFSVSAAGALTASSGTIGGFTITSTYLGGAGGFTLYADGTIDGGSANTIFYGKANIGGATAGSEKLIVNGASNFVGNMAVGGNISSTNNITSDIAATFSAAGGTATQFQVLSTGLLRSLFTYNRQVSTSTRTVLQDNVGNFGNSTSTRRNKHEIESYKINSNALLQLDVKTFKYKLDLDSDQTTQYGFIAEDAQDLGLDELIQYDSTGIPDYFAYDKLPIFLLQLIQEQEGRIKALEAQLTTNS